MSHIKNIILFLLLSTNAAFAQRSWTADNGNGTFTNPLFYDEFSDPDILRVGNDYYLAGTTMHCVPGVNILHSTDLVNWEQWSYCFDRFDFTDDAFSLKNGKEIYGQGIWAPCIRYHKGKFYVFSNVNGKGLQVFIADDAKGPWKHVNMKGNIHDLSVLFDDDDKIYAIYGYGTVKCIQLKDDLSEPMYETERVIIPDGNAVGEGHHIYKMNGYYYLISTDYMPNGRTLCSRSKSIWGPYETITISADETYGYHGAARTQWKGRIVPDGTKFHIPEANVNATGCDNAHQGGIVSTPDGQWWALMMQDFHSIGRTVDLMPVTWKDGWPMIGLEGNFGRAPRTWLKPNCPQGSQSSPSTLSSPSTPSTLRTLSTLSSLSSPRAPYQRSEDFNNKTLGRIWQWNHNPDDKMWSLTGGKLKLKTMPAKQLMWARNTLTQRVIGPVSVITVELNVKNLKDGDVAGLGNINVPCSWLGVVRNVAKDSGAAQEYILRCFQQVDNDTLDIPLTTEQLKTSNYTLSLRLIGDYDNDEAQYAYSLDGENFKEIGRKMRLSYQLCTFQGSRAALFAFNVKGQNGGYALFDNFIVDEPKADRSQNIPYGKKFRIVNLATGLPAVATKHGVMHDTHPNDKSPQTVFTIEDKGNGKVVLRCEDGRYVMCSGYGMPGDVRMTDDASKAEVFLWQDYLDRQFMLFSFDRHLYMGKHPTTGSSYSLDFKGPDPARRNGAVFKWEEQ